MPISIPIINHIVLLIENLKAVEQNPWICWINPPFLLVVTIFLRWIPYETYPGSGSVLDDKDKETYSIFAFLYFSIHH